MVAGILHHLGVNMGPSRPPDAANPLGYFEDIRFRSLHRYWARRYEIRPARARLRLPPWESTLCANDIARYTRLIRICEQQPCWGIKDPELCYYAKHFATVAHRPIRVIATTRDVNATIESLGNARRHFSPAERTMIIREYVRRQALTFEELTAQDIPPPLMINYDEAIDNPEAAVRRIAEHVDLPVTAAATAFIVPRLRRYGQTQTGDTQRNDDQGVTTLMTQSLPRTLKQ